MTDAWSEIMRDAADGVSGQYLIERDDGRIETLEVGDYIKPFEEWDEPERQAIKHVKGRVLDIGCGAGRVAIYLQVLGYEVVGIDLAPGAVDASRRMGLKEAYVMSANDLTFSNDIFDTVVMYGNNFGVAGEEEHVLSMLRALQKITSPNAVILAGSANATNTEVEDHLKYHQMNRDRNRPPGLVRIRVKYKDYVTEWSDLWLVTLEELEELTEKSGWQIDKIYQTGKINQPAYVAVLSKR